MMKMAKAWLVLFLTLASPRWASAQHLFLDADGDGARTSRDSRAPAGTMSFGVYLTTDQNRDGSSSRLLSTGTGALTINSYEIIFRAVDGDVKWIRYVNEMSSMYLPLERYEGEGDYYVGYAGPEALPPGKYRLGTLTVEALKGTPRITFATSSPLRGVLGTSFGSRHMGRDGDNTLKLATSSEALATEGYGLGDWVDTDGVELRTAQAAGVDGLESPAAIRRFRVSSVSLAGANSGALRVETPTEGSLSVRLFDVSGRLIGALSDRTSVPAGTHDIPLKVGGNRRLAAGVYFYQVQAQGKVATGRVIILR